MSLPKLSVTRPVTTLMALVSVLVLGGVAWSRLPLAFLPEVDAPFIGIQIPYPNSNPTQIEKEITKLEALANPLEGEASEMRVKRLAMLKRNRRTVTESTRRRGDMKAKLENCAITLQNMKFDLLRLKTGHESWQRVTSIAEAAMQLAREVDSAIYVGDEMSRLQRPATRG